MKKYIDVVCEMKSTGKVVPLCIIWENGHKYAIDKVKEIKRAASLKVGGVGLRYEVFISGNLRYLFLDEYRWYIEVEN